MTNAAAIDALWNHLRLGRPLEPSDLILVPGHADLRCADFAAQLHAAGLAPRLVFSGASGRSTSGLFRESEAAAFARVARAGGVPDDAILLEERATNTGENVRFTRDLLARAGITTRRVIAVQKPYAERRALATLALHWPGVTFTLASPPGDFAAYCDARFTPRDTVEMLVGEIHRLLVYPDRGWQCADPVPRPVIEAFLHLVAAGHRRELVPGAALPVL